MEIRATFLTPSTCCLSSCTLNSLNLLEINPVPKSSQSCPDRELSLEFQGRDGRKICINVKFSTARNRNPPRTFSTCLQHLCIAPLRPCFHFDIQTPFLLCSQADVFFLQISFQPSRHSVKDASRHVTAPPPPPFKALGLDIRESIRLDL